MYNHLSLSFFNKSHKGLGIATRTKRNTIRNRNTGTKELPGFVSEHSLLNAIALPHNLHASVNSAKTMSFRCMHHGTCPMNVALHPGPVCLNSVLVDYLSQSNPGELLRLAETLASKTKARD